MFIDLTDKKILVAGGGTIALRRIRTLLKFRADIRVIAPELCEELAQLERKERLRQSAGNTALRISTAFRSSWRLRMIMR